MPLQQTIEIPANRMVRISPKVPVGRWRIVFFPEPPVPAKAEAEEPLPKVTQAQWAQWEEERKNDPIWQVLDQPVEPDWSWLPEGLTPETLTAKDIRALRIKEKYGI
jgi:hypothetical protein